MEVEGGERWEYKKMSYLKIRPWEKDFNELNQNNKHYEIRRWLDSPIKQATQCNLVGSTAGWGSGGRKERIKRNSRSPKIISIFRCVHASLWVYMRVCPYVGPSVGWSVCWSVRHAFFFKPRKLSGNSTESLEKSRYGSLTANKLSIVTKALTWLTILMRHVRPLTLTELDLEPYPWNAWVQNNFRKPWSMKQWPW